MENTLNLETEIVDFFDYFLQIDKPKTVIVGTPTTCGVTDKVVELMLDYFIFEDKSVLVYTNDKYKCAYFKRRIIECFEQHINFKEQLDFEENSFIWKGKILSIIEPFSEGFMCPTDKKINMIIVDKDLGEETKMFVENVLQQLSDNVFVFTNDFEHSMFYTSDTKYKTLFNNPSYEKHRENINKQLNDGLFLYG
jgi:hypothetical protein